MPPIETLNTVERLYDQALDRWQALSATECAAYAVLQELAHVGTLRGPVLDAAANAHYRAVVAMEQQRRRCDALGAALVRAVEEMRHAA